MNKFTLVGCCLMFAAATAFGAADSLTIPFLGTQPLIDGRPDASLTRLPWQELEPLNDQTGAGAPPRVRSAMAYGPSFLYILVESEGDTIVIRDRAYQNGDGFHLVVARPDTGAVTREFYVLRFSPADSTRSIPAKKGVWYYNVDLSSRPLSAQSKFVCSTAGGRSYFELLLAWSDVHPYNPLFSDSIGINLCFVKAVGEKGKRMYFLKYDGNMQSEQRGRTYVNARFAEPGRLAQVTTLARLRRSTLRVGDTLGIDVRSISPAGTARSMYCSVRSADNVRYIDRTIQMRSADNVRYIDRTIQMRSADNVHSIDRTVQLQPVGRETFSVPLGDLPPGGYRVAWRSSDESEGEMPLTVLPDIAVERDAAHLATMASRGISDGTMETMRFRLNDIGEELGRLKPYETAGTIREAYSAYQEDVRRLDTGNDIYAAKRGVFRRAFRSHIDGTLQPYSIRVPQDFDRSKRYPLLVMLHGSGSDDKGMLSGTPLSEGDFIEIAPYGRGTSNCFTTDHAEQDVREAIDDAIRNYPIDTAAIVIAGFSMGGYGAYRVFYEYPGLFTGVAVFSGHPNLASRWIGPGHPDFLDTAYTGVFREVPVFVYHSRNDLNCPYDLTVALVDTLRDAGARVTFITTESGGHGVVDGENAPQYYRWLSRLKR